MYIRTKSTPNSPRKSIQIVESVRDGDKVKQKIVRHVGIAFDENERQKLIELAEHIKAKLETEQQPSLFAPEDLTEIAIAHRKKSKDDDKPLHVNLKHLREEQRIVVGIHEVYGEVYKDLGFNEIFGNPKRNEKIEQLLYHIVMARIANPQSKRESVSMLERDFGVQLELQKVYRMMDRLDEKVVEKIQKLSQESAQGLLKEKINILFYDCTTLYFESFTEDNLKKNGYSKDMKFNQPQVLLALLVPQEGLPIGYEVFPGSCFEGHTLVPILEGLQNRYDVSNVVFVADSGLLNEANLTYLEKHDIKYIVGARLKGTPQALQEDILNKANYKKQIQESDSLADFTYGGRRLIVSHNLKRAEKDKYDREKAIEKLLKKLRSNKSNAKSLLSNYGYKKYLAIKGKTELAINEEKIEAASKWDGLHGVITNDKEAKVEDIVSHYKGLWQIEECFRISKHDLKIRPIYHWTPERIRAHIAISFMALTCVRNLTYRVALQYKKLSAEVIKRELVHTQLSFLKHVQTRERYCIPSNTSQDAKKIYQVMGLKLSAVPFKIK